MKKPKPTGWGRQHDGQEQLWVFGQTENMDVIFPEEIRNFKTVPTKHEAKCATLCTPKSQPSWHNLVSLCPASSSQEALESQVEGRAVVVGSSLIIAPWVRDNASPKWRCSCRPEADVQIQQPLTHEYFNLRNINLLFYKEEMHHFACKLTVDYSFIKYRFYNTFSYTLFFSYQYYFKTISLHH